MALRLPPVRRLRPLGPFRRLAHRYQYDIPLRRKLLLANVLIIALPLAALALFSTESVSRITERRASFSAEQSLEQAASYLNYTMYNIVKASDLIFLSSEVNSALSADHTDYPISNQLRDMNNLRNYLFSFQDGVNVDRVRLYVPPGLIYSDEDINLFNFATAQKSKWFQALERSGDSMLWCPSSLLTGDPGGGSSDRLSLARFLVDQNDLRRRIGALRLDFRKEAVRAILRKADTIVGSESYIVGRDDALVASSDPAANNRIRLASRQEAALPTDGLFRRMVVSGRTVLVGARPLRESSWIVVTVVPYAAITAESRNVRDGIFLVMLAALLIATLASYFISGTITRRVSSLMTTMKGPERGGLEKVAPAHGRDEVGRLMVAYNSMTDRIRELIEVEATTRQKLKEAELKALQAQINPHFLYNTLDLINWLTQQGSSANVGSVVKWLADFYRIALSSGKTIIPLRDEIEHVTLYYRIQNLRFPGSLRLLIELDDSLLDFSILKTTLQPLVENAIHHGIRERPDKSGTIVISGRIEHDDLVLDVIDDGVGIAAERLPGLLVDTASAEESGFGLRNIHDRLRLQYGPGYGLSFSSGRGKGTTVTVRIQAVQT